jgi:uncharacterized protein with GYD domain
MSTYVMLTTLMPEAVKSPGDLKGLEKKVTERIRKELPQVKWTGNFAILGPCDYLDIFEAPDEEEAAKVSLIVRSFGHARTEIWTAIKWERFQQVVPA